MVDIPQQHIRDEWLYEAACASQHVLCDVRARGSEARQIVEALALLPHPETPLEGLVRDGLILKVLLGCVDDGSDPHAGRTRNVLLRLLDGVARPSRLLESLARRAAALIRAESVQPLCVSRIARSVGCDQTRLRRAFLQEYGITMRDFHTRCRVAHALRMFATGETEIGFVARSVGYRSEKNFYRALRNVTGQKPAHLRGMPAAALSVIARDVVAAFAV